MYGGERMSGNGFGGMGAEEDWESWEEKKISIRQVAQEVIITYVAFMLYLYSTVLVLNWRQ